jgi:uncharacterized protein (TIGR02266 family)
VIERVLVTTPEAEVDPFAVRVVETTNDLGDSAPAAPSAAEDDVRAFVERELAAQSEGEPSMELDPTAKAAPPEALADLPQLHPHDSNPPARAEPRHRLELEVSICSESNFYAGFTENLSGSGVFVATYLIKPIGTPVTLDVQVPGLVKPMRLQGIVRWIRLPSANRELWPGMGVQFEALSAEAESVVAAFLEQREPLFFA